MIKKESRKFLRLLRKRKIGKKALRNSSRPRLSVYKSSMQVYAQIIDDFKGHTLTSASSLEKEIKVRAKKRIEKAKLVGELLAERAKKIGIKEVVFDRAGYKYHGVVAALAEAARDKGLEF